MPQYELVNPYIIGDMKMSVKSSNSTEAASDLWNKLSKYVTNSVPKFVFTIKKVQSGGSDKKSKEPKLYHYMVKEKLLKNKNVSFIISEYNLELTDKQKNSLLSHISNLEKPKSGGKHKHKNKHHKHDKHDKDNSEDKSEKTESENQTDKKTENDDSSSSDSSSSDSSSSSSSSSSSESDTNALIQKIKYLKNKAVYDPLSYLWYNPLIYTIGNTTKDGNLTSVYMPTFSYPIIPYYELNLSNILIY
jgi:hypothetical protein